MALVEALERKQIAGAAFDVFSKEPPTDSPLLGHPRVLTLPHLGASTVEAQMLTGVDVAEGVVDALKGATPLRGECAVRGPEEWSVLAPYIALGRKLGELCIRLVTDPVRVYELEYLGELAEVTKAPVRLAVLRACSQVYASSASLR